MYPLYYARTALGADIGVNKKYTSTIDCIMKTVSQNGVLALYRGVVPSFISIPVYRGAQYGLNDILRAFNPYAREVSFRAIGIKFMLA